MIHATEELARAIRRAKITKNYDAPLIPFSPPIARSIQPSEKPTLCKLSGVVIGRFYGNIMSPFTAVISTASIEHPDLLSQTYLVKAIQHAMCRASGIKYNDMISHRRTREIVRPRQLAMAIAKRLTLKSLPDIGRRFGGRDHTTVLHAVRKMEPVMEIVSQRCFKGTDIKDWARQSIIVADELGI